MLLIYFLLVTLVLVVDVTLALTVYQQRHVNTANIRLATNQSLLFRSRDWLSANRGPVLLVDVTLALTVYQQRHVNTANIRCAVGVQLLYVQWLCCTVYVKLLLHILY